MNLDICNVDSSAKGGYHGGILYFRSHMMILERPPQRWWWNICSHCRSQRTLVILREETDELYGIRRIFRCKKCGEETVFVDELPEGCV